MENILERSTTMNEEDFKEKMGTLSIKRQVTIYTLELNLTEYQIHTLKWMFSKILNSSYEPDKPAFSPDELNLVRDIMTGVDWS